MFIKVIKILIAVACFWVVGLASSLWIKPSASFPEVAHPIVVIGVGVWMMSVILGRPQSKQKTV